MTIRRAMTAGPSPWGLRPAEDMGCTGDNDAAPRSARTRQILLVEPDDLLRSLFKVALWDAGYWVVDVADGELAMAQLVRTHAPIDALITELQLRPGPDGWTLAHNARARAADLPVIYMTGARADEWQARRVEHGALLLKPFVVAQMIDFLDDLIRLADEDRRGLA